MSAMILFSMDNSRPSLTQIQLPPFRGPGDVHGPLALGRDSRRERLKWTVFAVHEIGHRGRPDETRQPSHDLADVGVRRHRVDLFDPRRYRNELAVHLHLLRAVA